MMTNEEYCTITNRSPGFVSYRIEDMRIERLLNSGETFRVPSIEMERLAQQRGGRELIYNYIQIHEPDVVKKVLNIDIAQEPE